MGKKKFPRSSEAQMECTCSIQILQQWKKSSIRLLPDTLEGMGKIIHQLAGVFFISNSYTYNRSLIFLVE